MWPGTLSQEKGSRSARKACRVALSAKQEALASPGNPNSLALSDQHSVTEIPNLVELDDRVDEGVFGVVAEEVVDPVGRQQKHRDAAQT